MNAKWHDRFMSFLLGIMTMVVINILCEIIAKPMPEAEQRLHDAIHEYKAAWEANR